MRVLFEIGECPCGLSIMAFKTSNHKRFAKCEDCGFFYSLPKAGSIEHSGLKCPKTNIPVLIIKPSNHSRIKKKAYLWAEGPCFTCTEQDKCEVHKDMLEEFIENEELAGCPFKTGDIITQLKDEGSTKGGQSFTVEIRPATRNGSDSLMFLEEIELWSSNYTNFRR